MIAILVYAGGGVAAVLCSRFWLTRRTGRKFLFRRLCGSGIGEIIGGFYKGGLSGASNKYISHNFIQYNLSVHQFQINLPIPKSIYKTYIIKVAKITLIIPHLLLPLLLLLTVNRAQNFDCHPFGVRLSFGQSITNSSSAQKLSIRFNTKIRCDRSYVTVQKMGSIRKIYCDGTEVAFGSYSTYVKKCSILDVVEGDSIQYMVFGWSGNSSDPQIPYTNTPIPYTSPKPTQQFKMLTLADWSYLRQSRTKYKPLDDSFTYLLETNQKIDAIFINGDIAYDLQSNNGRNYEDFLNMISQVSVRWPVIVNPGNHQHRDQNYWILVGTFQVYGFGVGGGGGGGRVVRMGLPGFCFILFDPYQILYNKEPQNISYGAFRKQLNTAYSQKSLIILASHYPFRCNGDPKDCQTKHEQMSQFFSAMFEVNAPLYLGAHFHAYQRHYPFKSDGRYKRTSQVEWDFQRKMEERVLVSVVEGVAGNDLGMVQGVDQLGDFTAAYSYNVTGYGILKVGPLRLSYSHYTSSNPSTPIDFFQMFLKRSPKLQLRTQ